MMSKKNVKKAVALMMAVLMLVSFAACGKSGDDNGGGIFSKKINITECVTVTYEGLSGIATVDYDVNEETLDSYFSPEEITEIVREYYKFIGYAEEDISDRDFYEGWRLSDVLDIDLVSDNQYLSNGDKLIFTVEADDDQISLENIRKFYNVSFEDTFEITVSGIKEGTKIDVLKDMSQFVEYVDFSFFDERQAANGAAYATVRVPETYSKESNGFYIKGVNGTERLSIVKDNQSIGEIYVEVICEGGIENGKLHEGDKIILSVKDFSNELVEYDAVFADVEIEVTVPDLPDPATSADQISSADIDKIAQEILAENDNTFFESDTCEVYAVYGGTLNADGILEEGLVSKFSLFVVLKQTEEDIWFGGVSESYHIYKVDDVMTMADGSVVYKADQVDRVTAPEEVETSLAACDYTCSKIK